MPLTLASENKGNSPDRYSWVAKREFGKIFVGVKEEQTAPSYKDQVEPIGLQLAPVDFPEVE